jgi:hypothetical protein
MTRMTVAETCLLLSLLVFGCDRSVGPASQPDVITGIDGEVAQLAASVHPVFNTAPPSPLVDVSVGPDTLRLWPYVGRNYSGEPQDPVNIIFFGKTDPRDIRASLMALDGDRSSLGLPPVPPFNSQWTDAIGEEQVAYSEPEGWAGSVIQLACGDYDLRFHLRLFQAGEWTLGGAHFEILVPGTSEHRVLSWEVAEDFVVGDFMRSGLLDEIMPVIPTGPINDSPFRTISALLYNELPDELIALIGGPAKPVSEDVPIGTDGAAKILNLANAVPWQPDATSQEFVLNFGLAVEKPFCSTGVWDIVYVEGAVSLSQTVDISSTGYYNMLFHARGTLTVTPVDPTTGQFVGEPLTAHVREQYSAAMNDHHASVFSLQFQKLLPGGAEGAGQLYRLLRWNSAGANGFAENIRCASEMMMATNP